MDANRAEHLKHRKTGIGPKIGRLVATSIFVATLAVALSLAYIKVHQDIAQKRQQLANTGYVLASSVADSLLKENTKASLAILSATSRIPEIRSLLVVNAKNQVHASMGQTTYLESELAGSTNSDLSLLSKGVLPVAVDVIKGGERVGRLIMLADITDMRKSFIWTLITTVLAAISAAILGFLVSRPLQQNIVNPIVSLTSRISAIRKSRGYGHDILDPAAEGEVAVLVENFNGLMSDIRFRDDTLRKIAFFDQLTGLANRASFENSLDDWIKSHADAPLPGAVAHFTIHGFNNLNDAFGQTVGSAILLNVAAAINEAAGPDGLAARIGGNDFAVLFENVRTLQQAEQQIASIQAAFYAPLKIMQLELNVSLCTAMVMLADVAVKSKYEILRCAGLAISEAKLMGSGSTIFYIPALSEKLQREVEMGQELRNAIADGEMLLHYQAQFDFQTQRITGFEALARWQHPQRGFIPPNLFIPVAERNGLIVMLGDWVLLEACKQAKQWLDTDAHPRKISVNISPAQILEAGFVSKVNAALAQTNLPPHLLCLEITETLFLGASMDAVRIILAQLEELGVKLALDDFGTGYSSLGYLAKLPFHTIKIDRSFVAKADASPRRMKILQSVIAMCHSLGMRVVAEGAETDAELVMLRSLAADEVQGFGIARPLPAKAAFEKAYEVDSNSTALAKSA